MSSPLARPRPGEPRYFVKRSPGGVSPAKMMSREEAAEMMMRTEFSAFSRGVDADVSASATPEKRPESPQATRAADTDKVAARLVAAANARAEDAERRAFETEERAAARVADAEHDARQAADALGDARRVIAELEHHVAETAMRRDERTSAVRLDDGVADAERANAVAEANRRRLAAELEVDELKAELEEAAKSTTATRDAARRALEAREKDARASDEALRARIVEIETAFARERESRTKAEATAQEHERRRIRAIERLLERTARRDEPSALRAALVAADANVNPSEKTKSVTLTSAEEELVAIEGEHERELERLRADLAAAKAETARSVARAEASDALLKKTRREGETTRSENEHLYRVIDRSNSTLGPKGVSVALRALKALDSIEARAVATYRVATRAMDVARRACDAAEDVASNDATRPAIAEIERGVEGNWVVSRDVLSETWHVAGETRGTLQRVRGEAATLGARLERAATREANARVRADVARRSKAFRALSVTDTYPKEKENDADVVDAIDDIGIRGSTQTEAGGRAESDDLDTPLRLTRRPMSTSSSSPWTRRDRPASAGPLGVLNAASPASRVEIPPRGRSPVWNPGSPSARQKTNTGTREKARSASPPRADSTLRPANRLGDPSRTPSPARSSLSRSPSAFASRSPGARRRVTFGEVTTWRDLSPGLAHRRVGLRPRSAPGRAGNTRTASRVGAYIRGETGSVTSATEEKKALARRAAVAAAEKAAAEARAKASNPRSRTAPRPWHTEPRSFGSNLRARNLRPQSAKNARSFGPNPARSPSPSPEPGARSPTRRVRLGPSRDASPSRRGVSRSPSRRVPHPPPRDAVIASQRSPSKSPPTPGSQRHRDAIVSRTLKP